MSTLIAGSTLFSFLSNFSNLIKHFPVLETSKTTAAICHCPTFCFPLLGMRPDDNHVIIRIWNMNIELWFYIQAYLPLFWWFLTLNVSFICWVLNVIQSLLKQFCELHMNLSTLFYKPKITCLYNRKKKVQSQIWVCSSHL